MSQDIPNATARNAASRRRPPPQDKRPALAEGSDSLRAYRSKRDFTRTKEPNGEAANEAAAGAGSQPASFVVQKHWARRLHYDFRLEIDGTLKSWAVPKGPSLDPSVKRLAVQVEDHPLAYGSFEGTIPKGEYGAGKVIVWDTGHWEIDGDPVKSYQAGKLKIRLKGSKLQGAWMLVRTGGRRHDPNTATSGSESESEDKQISWLLIKENDEYAQPEAEYEVTEALPDSVSAQVAEAEKVLPEKLEPQLATRVSAAPTSKGWCFELKYDGYRILTRVHKGRARLHTRNGHDWTHRLPTLAKSIESQKLPDGWYDGEIVMLDAQGRPNFQALQNAFELSGAGAEKRSASTPNDQNKTASVGPVYFLFDLPWLEGQDLRALPLRERQHHLARILNEVDDPSLRLSGVFTSDARDMLRSACELGLEGIIGKRLDSPYVSGRSGHWIKLKCGERQEFVIGGYTEPQGGRQGLGALLLGYFDEEGGLQYAGKVGSGFSDKTLETLHSQLSRLQTSSSPFSPAPKEPRSHWVKPKLAAEVAFSQWTQTGRIRHAVFQGLREDKRISEMKKERGVKISSAEREVDKKSGTNKGDVATYYERFAELILPHLKDRPVSLLRAPDGLKGELFFQKHVDADRLPGLMELDPALDPGHAPLVVVRNAAGLTQAAQLNTIEFHTWNAVRTRIDRPDRITFDLDPGKGVQWKEVQEAAVLLRNFLEELGLPSFVKTSGGKGLHVVVPIVRRYDWDTAKGFSKAVVQHMAGVLPRRFSAKSGPRNRIGKIFIDYLRNGFGATTVAAWSLRARPGMGVSVPITWDEVETIGGGDHWTILNIDERLAQGNQPWDGYEKSATALGPAMKRLAYEN